MLVIYETSVGLGLAGFNICFLVVRWRASTQYTVTALGLGLLALPLAFDDPAGTPELSLPLCAHGLGVPTRDPAPGPAWLYTLTYVLHLTFPFFPSWLGEGLSL